MRPTVGGVSLLVARRLAHHQPATRPEEPDGALGGHGRGPEGAGDDGVERLAQIGPAGGVLRPRLDDRHPGQSECRDGVPQEPAGPPPGLEQRQVDCRAVGGQHETGKPTPAAEVEDPALLRQPGQQGPPVFDVPGDGTGPEKAQVLRPEENRFQIAGAQEVLASALMTTRRRGSSPSETVATPSISFTMS